MIVSQIDKSQVSPSLVAITADHKFVEPYFWHATPTPCVDAAAKVSQVLPMVPPSLEGILRVVFAAAESGEHDGARYFKKHLKSVKCDSFHFRMTSLR